MYILMYIQSSPPWWLPFSSSSYWFIFSVCETVVTLTLVKIGPCGFHTARNRKRHRGFFFFCHSRGYFSRGTLLWTSGHKPTSRLFNHHIGKSFWPSTHASIHFFLPLILVSAVLKKGKQNKSNVLFLGTSSSCSCGVTHHFQATREM